MLVTVGQSELTKKGGGKGIKSEESLTRKTHILLESSKEMESPAPQDCF